MTPTRPFWENAVMYLAHHGRRASGARRFTGVSLAVLVTALVGYALTAGLKITPPIAAPSSTVFTAPSETKPAPDDAPKFKDTDIRLPTTIVQPIPLGPIDFDKGVEANPGPLPGPTVPTRTGGEITPPAPLPIKRTIPALSRSAQKPDYPIGAIRAQEEGVTTLALCISSQGRVMTASIASGSGHQRLDDAALKWVRTQRFNPATENGSPVATCTHTLAYEWKLENAR